MTKRSGLLARSGSIQAAIVAAKGKAAAELEEASGKPRGRVVGLTVRIDQETHDRLRRIAFEKRVSIHSLLLEGIAATIAKHR